MIGKFFQKKKGGFISFLVSYFANFDWLCLGIECISFNALRFELYRCTLCIVCKRFELYMLNYTLKLCGTENKFQVVILVPQVPNSG